MGAAFLCAHCRIDSERHHAGCLASWLKDLRQDKRAIFVVATRAQRAADYLLRVVATPRPEGGRTGCLKQLRVATRPRLIPGISHFYHLKGSTMETNYFARLNEINVSDHVEKKGDFSYLSWPYAVAQLLLADPAACWEVRRFDGLPYLKIEAGYFVEVAVTVQGVTLSQIRPVLDGKNQPLFEPTAFDVNSQPIQRCLVKAIALHGLGLYVYVGEDLPDEASRTKMVVDKHFRYLHPAILCTSVSAIAGEFRLALFR